MRAPRLALAASAALLLSGLVLPSQAAPPVVPVNDCIESVPEPGSTAAVSICYSLYKPPGASASAPVPMVLHSHGWGGSRTNAVGAFRSWTDAGYGVLSFDQRGFGESGGLAHVEHPDLEGQDVKRLVDLVASLDWVAREHRPEQARGRSAGQGQGHKKGHGKGHDKGQGHKKGHDKGHDKGRGHGQAARTPDPVLGAIGGSYGGGYQYVGAFTELRDLGYTRFDALAPEITWHDLKDSLAPDEVPRSTWQAALQAAGMKDEPRELQAGYVYGTATGLWPGKGNPVADLDAFFAKNGPAWHVSQGRRLDIPVLLRQGITDNLFNLDQALDNYDLTMTDRARQRSVLIGYNGGHALPNALPRGRGDAGDPCTTQTFGSRDFTALTQRFFDHELRHRGAPLPGRGRYHLATPDGKRCVTVDSVAPTTSVALGSIRTTTGAGAPVAYEIPTRPDGVLIAGRSRVTATVTSLGVHNRAFLALSVGTSPLDAQVVANNVLPLAEPEPVSEVQRTVELPAVAVDVQPGQKLFLTVSPVSDMFALHGSRTPGVLLLDDVVVHLPAGPVPR